MVCDLDEIDSPGSVLLVKTCKYLHLTVCNRQSYSP